MDQNLVNRYKEILWDLLANPAENGRSHRQTLERLVQDDPQSGLLQVLYARTADTPDIQKASAYFAPRALFKIINDPDSLPPVSRHQIDQPVNKDTAQPENYFNIGTEAETEVETQAPQEAELSDTTPVEGITQISTETGTTEPTELSIISTEEDLHGIAADSHVAAAYEAVQPAVETHYAEPHDEHSQNTEAVVTEETDLTPVEEFSPDNSDDGHAQLWDFESTEETAEADTDTSQEELATAEPEVLRAANNDAQQQVTPEAEPEVQPVAANVPSVNDFGIHTYDHSLSEYELQAIDQSGAATGEETQPEVSSFGNYAVENVFHKQDEIDDDVYDEIVSIDDIGVAGLNNKFALDIDADEEDVPAEATIDAATEAPFDPETERLIYSNIAATDYLSFDKKLDELRGGFAAAAETQPIAPEPENVTKAAAEENAAPSAHAEPAAGAEKEPAVALYNDNTMPYSFMWWLDKTRREHAGSYQPYAQTAAIGQPGAAQPQKAAGNELQQQYYENIFSLTSMSSIGSLEQPNIEFDHNKKEDIIIERFIQTDPQIKPLSADKLDNENKAKRSSEDQDAMVTETLARIYSDQMLYHKAIATYKKLILKIPEKKLYFAAQIEQLEKKIN